MRTKNQVQVQEKEKNEEMRGRPLFLRGKNMLPTEQHLVRFSRSLVCGS